MSQIDRRNFIFGLGATALVGLQATSAEAGVNVPIRPEDREERTQPTPRPATAPVAAAAPAPETQTRVAQAEPTARPNAIVTPYAYNERNRNNIPPQMLYETHTASRDRIVLPDGSVRAKHQLWK